MPTPFMHLEIAEQIRINHRLVGPGKQSLNEHFSAFYLGSVAPDVQSVANIRREETHFYRVPPALSDRAYPTMLARYPQLADSSDLPQDQALFIAGYCAHLMLDLRWYHEVLLPFFVEGESWRSHKQAFIVHNTLLTYLDKSAAEALPDGASETLAAAQPQDWLPFAQDSDLVKWRDVLVKQLRPGAMLQTVEVYAQRLGMSPEKFASNLEEPEWMKEHLFDRVPIKDVLSILHSAIDESIDIISEYLSDHS